MKSKVIISLFETVKLSLSISPRNLYNSLKGIKEKLFVHEEVSGIRIDYWQIIAPRIMLFYTEVGNEMQWLNLV